MTLKGRGHMAIRCDVTRRKDCEKAVERVIARHNRLDILLNYAGITSPQRVMQVDDATYNRIFDINMRGTYHMIVSDTGEEFDAAVPAFSLDSPHEKHAIN